MANTAQILTALSLVVLTGIAAAAPPSPGHDASSMDVAYKSDGLTLTAQLLLPAAAGPVAAVVIAQGSGASDRNNHWARDVSEALLQMGVAVLLTDKRGSGASEGDWRTASFRDLAADVVAGAAHLRGRPEIDASRVGVVGLSQGGQVAAVAASRSDLVAFVVNVSGKAVGFAEGSFIEMANTARQAGLSEPQVDAVLELNRAAARYAAGGSWAAYEATRRAALTSPIREIAEGFPASEDAPIWTFLSSAVLFDPLAYWVQVEQPVFVVYGEADERDNVPVAESVRRLEHAFAAVNKRNYQIVVVPSATHGIRDPSTGRLSGAFLQRLDDWIERTAGTAMP